jgi:hypothetical protein
MLRRHRLDAIKRKRELEIEGLLGPERAIVSKVAIRSGTGTKSAPPSLVTRPTKSVIVFFVAPSFQEGKGSEDWAYALVLNAPKAETSMATKNSRLMTFIIFDIRHVSTGKKWQSTYYVFSLDLLTSEEDVSLV